ncbi:hypothetical protein EMGR_004689, partial [Emarellia grisea]
HKLGQAKSLGDVRMVADRFSQGLPGNTRHLARREGAHRIVQLAKIEGINPAEIARQQVGYDLPLTGEALPVEAGKALQHQDGVPGNLAFSDQVNVRSDRARLACNPLKHSEVRCRQVHQALELADQQVARLRS